MNILFINHHASAPIFGNPYRTYYLAKNLVALGHKVTIATASYSHIRQSQPKCSRSLVIEKIDGINYIFIPSSTYKFSSISRILNIISFIFSYWQHKNTIIETAKPHVVIEATTYIIPFLVSKLIAKKTKSILAFEMRDIWPLSIMEIGGYTKYNPLIFLMMICQKMAVKDSDYIISTLCNANSYLAKEIGSPKSFIHIQNGIDIKSYEKQSTIDGNVFSRIKKIRDEYQHIIGYTGSIGKANAIQTLVDSNSFLDREKIAIVIIGKGEIKEQLTNSIEKNNFSNVFVFEEVSKTEIIAITKLFDLGFVGGKKRLIHQYGVSPNKLFDYMICSVPVLFCIDSPDKIVEKANCGIEVPDPNPRTVAHEISFFLQKPLKDRKIIGNNGYNYCLEHYDYSKLATKLLDEITRHLDQSPLETLNCDSYHCQKPK